MKKSFLRKILNVISALAIVSQSLTPYAVLLPQASYAQEVTPADPTPTIDQSTPPADTATPTPTVDQTTPTEEVSPTPSDTVSETPTPTPTEDPAIATPTPVDNLSPPDSSQTPTDTSAQVQGESITPTPPLSSADATPTPTQVPENPKDEQLNLIILDNVSAPSIDLEAIESQGSAVLTTDKPDYAPTDTALITGSNLLPNTTYTLRVWSEDEPVTSTTVEVTSDENGVFAYAYQLDGTYRPNYSAELKDSSGNVVASTTFTDSPAVTTTVNNVACVAEQPGQEHLTCEANDISLAAVSNITINGHGCRFPGDTVNFTANWQLASNANDRYNVGLWFNTSGGTSALHGTCSATSLPSSPAPFTDSGTGSICGGIDNSSLGTISITQTAVCNPDSSGFLKLPYCTTWQQNKNNACTTPTDTVPGSPSKCNCQNGFTIPITVPPSIEVIKVLSPSNDSGRFDLLINGTATASGTNVGNGGTTGKVGVTVGSNTAGEVGNNTSLNDYTSTVSCVLRGTQTAVNTTGTNPWTLNVTNGQDIVCTITNTKLTGTITVNKTLVPANDPGKFNLQIDGQTLGAGANVGDTGTTGAVTVNTTGQHTVSEIAGTNTSLSDYTTTYSCNNNLSGSGTSVPAFSVTANQNVICTFTNMRDTGTIELKKVWSGTGGQTTLNIGTTASDSQVDTQLTGAAGAAPLTTGVNTVNTGTYYVSETSLPDYNTSLSCVDAAGAPVTVGANNSVVVTKDDVITCTFANTRKQGKIELQKDFVGTPESVTIKIGTSQNGTQVDSDVLSADGTDGEHAVDTRNYFVSEELTTPANYTTGLACYNDVNDNDAVDGGDTSHIVNTNTGEVTVGQNDDVICVFTNTRNTGTIIVKKVMVGGTDTFTYTGIPNGSISSNNGTIQATVDTGSYSSVEGAKTGWDLTSIVCDDNNSTGNLGARTANFNVESGKTVTCTFTNTKKGHVIIKKDAISDSSQVFTFNNNFGNGNPATFNLTDDSTPGLPSYDAEVLPGKYAVSEDPITGWQLDGTSCDQGETVNDIDVAPGETVTCTFTNEKLAKIILVKNTVGGDGTFDFDATGEGLPTDIDATTVNGTKSFTFDNRNPDNTYSFAENVPSGWELTSASCDNGDPVTAITPNAGEVITCTFTNTKLGNVTVVKYHDHNANGIKDDGDEVLNGWTIYAATNSGTASQATDGSGQVVFGNLIQDTYTLSENIKDGWFQSNISCTGDTGIDNDNSHPVTLTAGQNLICEIGNYQRGHVKVIKHIVDPDGQELFDNSTEFTFNVSATGTNSAVLGDDENYTFDVNPGLNTVEEITNQNYDFAGCTGGIDGVTFNGEVVTVGSGETVEVICTNKQKKATITVVKDVTKSDGSAVDDNHLFQVTLNSETKDLSEQTDAVFTVNPGTYSATESADPNYTLVSNDVPKTVGSNGRATISIVNKQNPGTISGTKFDENQNVLSGWTINLFSCTALGINCTTFLTSTVTTGSGYSFSNLVSGFYRVVEIMQDGWTNVTSLFRDVTINPGSTVTQQDFVNKGALSITACKYEDSNGTLQGGTFTAVNNWTFTLGSSVATTSANGCTTFTDLKPGTYTVTELPLPSGWFVVDDSLGSRQVVLTNGNQNVNFFNYQKGSITVNKNVDTNGDGRVDVFGVTDWKWNINGSGNYDTGSEVPNLDPNTYTVSEVQKDGYHVTDLTCNDISYGAVESQKLTLSSNGSIDCTFTNTRDTGTITVDKVTEPSDDKTKFDINLTQGTTTVHTSTLSDTDDPDTYTVLSGTYKLSEETVPGWDLTNISCIDSDQAPVDPNEFTVSNEDEIFCTFTNTRRGSVVVTKFLDDNANGAWDGNEEVLGDWDINLTNEGDYDETQQTENAGPDFGTTTFENLVPGQYDLSENFPKTGNWNQSAIYCENDQRPNGVISNSHPLNVDAGKTVNCYIGNYEDAEIIVKKVLYQPDGTTVASNDDTQFGFSLTGQDDFNLANGDSQPFEVKPGTYTVNESDIPTYYDFIDCVADYEYGGEGIPATNGEEVTLGSGDDVTVTCYNKQQGGTITGDKFNDIIGEGQECSYNNDDEKTCQPKLSGWIINLYANDDEEPGTLADSTTTDENGLYSFDNVIPGAYFVCEEQRTGWNQTYPYDNYFFEGYGDCYLIDVTSGFNTERQFNFGNHNLTPILTISKVNDAVGNKAPGDSVGFTITIAADETGGPADNVKVVDLLPSGFKYVPGSWSANSNLNGVLSLAEPTYTSPGVWTVGHMDPGEIITLKYQAKIDGGQATGTYYDNAWGQGTAVGNSTVIFARAVDPGDLDPSVNPSEFVGTEIKIVNGNKAGVDYKATSTKEVLGAATYLPATGEDTLWVIIAALLSITGFGMLIAGLKLRRKYA